MPTAEATDPANNPFSTDSTGRFVAEPVIDFAQDAIDRAREARAKSLKNPEDDWALMWRVRREALDGLTPGFRDGSGHEDQDDRDDEGPEPESDSA